MDENTLYTSSGIIKNRHLPRIGVISGHSQLLCEFIWDEIDNGINFTFENYMEEQEDEFRAGFLVDQEDDENLTDERIDEIVEERLNELAEGYESDNDIILFGDAWEVQEDGSYQINKEKEFAAAYNTGDGEICVEWSKYTKQCNHTSPCYVMANGDGPCGNLEQKGDAVIAYDLPPGFYRKD